jgi:hypothetical protein
VASPDALRALIETLEGEQQRRRAAQFGGQDPHTWLMDTLERMAERLVATAHLAPFTVDDMAPVELLACHLLPEGMRPAGLPAEDDIWSKIRTRLADSRGLSRG